MRVQHIKRSVTHPRIYRSIDVSMHVRMSYTQVHGISNWKE
jgi:hypothetical protein